jgi:hypothetical protein
MFFMFRIRMKNNCKCSFQGARNLAGRGSLAAGGARQAADQGPGPGGRGQEAQGRGREGEEGEGGGGRGGAHGSEEAVHQVRIRDLKGLSHEIDFKNVVENGQILALIRARAGF